jgi:hypothetical protein
MDRHRLSRDRCVEDTLAPGKRVRLDRLTRGTLISTDADGRSVTIQNSTMIAVDNDEEVVCLMDAPTVDSDNIEW